MGSKYIEFTTLFCFMYVLNVNNKNFKGNISKQKEGQLKLNESYNTQGCEISQEPKL